MEGLIEEEERLIHAENIYRKSNVEGLTEEEERLINAENIY